MKKLKQLLTNILLCVLFSFQISAQSPTLSAGLDNVAFKKGTLDVELLTKIISEKQREIVREGIKRILIDHIIKNKKLDDYTQFYIERLTNILFKEKNHKVITKRILEESTNYLFVLGTTKFLIESKDNEIKNLLKDINSLINNEGSVNQVTDFNSLINNTYLRNETIKIVLSICKEVPVLKKIGLLNDFNYQEHNKIYNSNIYKGIFDDLKKIDFNDILSRINIVFKNDSIVANLNVIDSYFKDNKKLEKKELEKFNNLVQATSNNVSKILKIEKGYKKEILKKLISKNIFSKEQKLKTIKKIVYSINFINDLLSESDLIKDIVSKSGLNFSHSKRDSILDNYKNIYMRSKELGKLVFSKGKNKNLINLIKEIENYNNNYSYNIEKINSSIKNINIKLSNLKNNDEQYTITSETIEYFKSLKDDLHKNIINDTKLSSFNNIKSYINKINTLTDENIFLKRFTRDVKTNINDFESNLNISFYKKLKGEYKKSRDLYKILEAIYKLQKDSLDKNIVRFKDYYSDLIEDKERNKTLLLTINNTIIENTDSLTKDSLTKYLLFYKGLISKYSELSNLPENPYPKDKYTDLITNLNILHEKIIIGKQTDNNYKNNELFHQIKDYLKRDEIKLKSAVNLTEKESESLKKLYSFFYNKNLNKNINNFKITEVFNSDFLSELEILSFKIKNDSTNNNPLKKVISSIDFALTNLFLKKIKDIDSKNIKLDNQGKLINFLKFIGNIKELNKAETFSFLLKTMNDYKSLLDTDKEKIIPDLINSLRNYSIIDLENNLIEIDAASVLTHITEKYQHQGAYNFYVTVGVNQFFDFKGQEFSAASEKIGVKIRLHNYNKNYSEMFHSVKRENFISDIYCMPYASGLLYKIAKTTDERFNKVNVGIAFGATFYNALDFNVSIAVPTNGFEHTFYGFSLDIPLSEYLKRL